MTLGGLWHGAGLTFVAWGALHGLGLGAGVLWRRAGGRCRRSLGWALTFALRGADLGAVPRAELRGGAGDLQGPVRPRAVGSGFKWRTIVLAAAVAMVGPTRLGMPSTACRPRAGSPSAFALLFVIVLLKIGDDANYEFIYFQF